MGMLTKKIHCHDRPLVRTPPSTGPTATATPVIDPQMPKAVPRSLPWKASASRAREVANMTAPPMPWPPRERINMTDDWASPQSSEPRVNTTSPITNTMRRPNRSDNEPAVRSSAARVRA